MIGHAQGHQLPLAVHRQALPAGTCAVQYDLGEGRPVVQPPAYESAQAATAGAGLEIVQHWLNALLAEPDAVADVAAVAACSMDIISP